MIRSRRPLRHRAARRFTARRWTPVLAALLLAASGCGDDNPAAPDAGNNGGNGATEGSELAGAWSVSRFAADGNDAISAGMSVDIQFDVTGQTAPRLRGALGTYTVTMLNDQLGLCDGETDCARTGSFDVQDGALRFNPDTQDELVWSYWVDGGTMGMSTTTDGITLQVEAQRTSAP